MPPPDTLPDQNPEGPTVSFLSQGVQPPSAIYLSPTDAILVQVLAATVDVTVSVQYRILRPDGTLITNTQTVPHLFAGGATTNFVIPPTEGFLLSMVLIPFFAVRGQCFCRVFLAPDASGANIPTQPHLILAGYVSLYNALAFPQGVPENELNGRGWLRSITLPNTTGVLTSVTVPASVRWIIRSVYMLYTADATVANRALVAQVLDTTGFLTAESAQPTQITANQLFGCTWAPGLTQVTIQNRMEAGFPAELLVAAGWSIQVSSNNTGVGDTFHNGRIVVEEFQAP